MYCWLKFYSMAPKEQEGVLRWSLAFSSKRHGEYYYGEGNVTMFLFNAHCCFITCMPMYKLYM